MECTTCCLTRNGVPPTWEWKGDQHTKKAATTATAIQVIRTMEAYTLYRTWPVVFLLYKVNLNCVETKKVQQFCHKMLNPPCQQKWKISPRSDLKSHIKRQIITAITKKYSSNPFTETISFECSE
jgi:hypothetical protein